MLNTHTKAGRNLTKSQHGSYTSSSTMRSYVIQCALCKLSNPIKSYIYTRKRLRKSQFCRHVGPIGVYRQQTSRYTSEMLK